MHRPFGLCLDEGCGVVGQIVPLAPENEPVVY